MESSLSPLCKLSIFGWVKKAQNFGGVTAPPIPMWHTSYNKILRWTRWGNSFFDWEPTSWSKNDIYSVTTPKVIFGCQAINVIFWPWNRLPIEKRVAPACSAQNFTIGGMSPQFFYHVPIGFRGASSTKTLIFILQKIRVFSLVAPLKPTGKG